MIWLGGLRGAIAYTMAISYSGPFREIFIGSTAASETFSQLTQIIAHIPLPKIMDGCGRLTGTTLVVIFVTVAGNGVAAGPTVRALGLGAAGLPGEVGQRVTRRN